MKGKIFLCIFLLVILMIAGFALWKIYYTENSEITEYTPEEEISEEQERMTLVTLYFIDKETKELAPEANLIDAKLLIKNPCGTLMELLLNGPKSEKLETVIPPNAKINKVTVEGRTAIVDFDTDFIRGVLGKEAESNIIYSIVNTLVGLSEIDSVKILIDGHEGAKFDDGEINFENAFVPSN